MYDLHQYFHGACEAGAYRITNFNASGCSAPKSCGDVGAMCQQIWHNDDDIAACVRANSFAATGGAISAADSLCGLRSTCCGANQQCQWKDNTCLSSTGESVPACSQYNTKETCDSKNCSTDYLSYTCIWDADLQKAVHLGPHTDGVCNPKDPDDPNQNTSMCAQAKKEPDCIAHAYCKWDTEHDAQPGTLETKGCYPGQDVPNETCT